MRSTNMISTTGLSPVIAAPTAAPTKAISEIGVSMTRPGPHSPMRPRGALARRALLVGEPVAQRLVTLVVAVEAIRHALDQAGTAAGAAARDRLVRGGEGRQHVLAVDGDARHAVGAGAVGDVVAGER